MLTPYFSRLLRAAAASAPSVSVVTTGERSVTDADARTVNFEAITGRSIVIDIETLDTTPRSAVTEIGVVAFERATFKPLAALDLKLDIFDQLPHRTVSQETIEFHRRNGTLPQILGGFTRFIAAAKLAEFIGEHSPKKVWIQGPDFERPIIEDIFADLKQPLPWHFTGSRDCRTNWDTAFPDTPHPKRPHRAIDDAFATLHCLELALTELKRRHAC